MGRHDAVSVFEYGYGSAAKSLREAHGWSRSQTFWLLSMPAGDGIHEFGVLVPRALPAGPRDGQPVPPHPTVDRRAEIGQDGVAGYEDHVDVQSGVGGDKVAAICMFIGPGSLYVLGLWPTIDRLLQPVGPRRIPALRCRAITVGCRPASINEYDEQISVVRSIS